MSFEYSIYASSAGFQSKQVQIRFDATNILNHPNLTAVQYSINNASFGTIANKGDQRRIFQGQLLLVF